MKSKRIYLSIALKAQRQENPEDPSKAPTNGRIRVKVWKEFGQVIREVGRTHPYARDDRREVRYMLLVGTSCVLRIFEEKVL